MASRRSARPTCRTATFCCASAAQSVRASSSRPRQRVLLSGLHPLRQRLELLYQLGIFGADGIILATRIVSRQCCGHRARERDGHATMVVIAYQVPFLGHVVVAAEAGTAERRADFLKA